MDRLFYRNRQLLLLTLLLILVWGLSAFFTLPRLEDPEIVQRFGRITTFLPGATPERVETLVTKKIEERLFELAEVKSLRSTSSTGISVISVELQDTIINVDPAWAKVRSKVDDSIPELPAAASVPEYADGSTKANSLIVGLDWTLAEPPNYSILSRLAETLEDRIRAIPGTEKVDVFGEPAEEIRVDVAPTELVRLELTAQGLANQIAASDAKVAAGTYRDLTNEFLLEVNSNLSSLEQIRTIPIQVGSDGQVTSLGTIANVTQSSQDPPDELAIVAGYPAIVIAAKVESGARVDLWATQAKQVLSTFEAELPRGLKLQVILDQSQYVQARLNGVVSNLISGSFLVIAISLVMLGWKSALLVGLALPLTTLMVFGAMQGLGVPLHQMSVTGLIIALGLLIDNAIIVVDEVQNRLDSNQPPGQAVGETVRHLFVPLLASTLTTVLAFVPIATSPGSTGEFIGTIGLTVILALLSSLVLSFTVIAALVGRLHHWQPLPEGEAWWQQGLSLPGLARHYYWSLGGVIRRPWLGVGLALILPVLGFAVFPTLPQQFFPPTNRDQVQIELELPTQTPLTATQTQVIQARAIALNHPDVADVHWFLGRSAPIFFYNVIENRRNAQNFAQGIVQLKTTDHLTQTIQDLQTQFNREFPQARVLVKQLEQGPPFDAPIEIRLYGADLGQLRQLGEQLQAQLAQISNVTHTRTTLTEALPKLAINVDQVQAQRVGLEPQTIATQLDAALTGVTGGSIMTGMRDIPVRVRFPIGDQGDLNRLSSLEIVTPTGPLPLDSLGSIELVTDIANINRRNGQRVNIVQGFITAGSLPSSILTQLQQRLATSDWQLPPGYRLDYGGEADAQGTAVGNLLSTVGVLAILMTATLVLSFNSFGLAALIGTVAFLSVGLAALALKVFGSIFGFTAILGTLGLMGLAINDSIVVLAALREHPLAKTGQPKAMQDVVFQATRHVIATTVTTIIGFVPLMLDATGFWPPLAIAIAGGLGGATVLALYYIPAAYRLILNWQKSGMKPTPQPNFVETFEQSSAQIDLDAVSGSTSVR